MIFTLLTLALPGVAWAVCASPTGTAGEVRFDLSDSALEYCNGTQWISMPRRPNEGCTTPGTNWTSVSIAANTWVSVAYGAGRFVAVAQSGTNRVMTSTDGASWSAAPSVPVSSGWGDVIYAGGQFVIVGSGTPILTSPDGLTWTQRTAPEANNWNGISYGNGYYVAVARSGTNRVMRSTDGITWTPHAAAQANQWFDVAFGNGRFVAITTAGTNQVMYSDDNGATWSLATPPAKSWNSVAYGNGRFVAVSTDAPLNIMHSTNGTAWTSISTPSGTQLSNVDFSGGLFIATGDNTTANNAVLTSSDGLTWSDENLPEAANWNGAASGNGILVVISNTGTNRIAVSNCANGTTYNWNSTSPQTYIPHPTNSWWDSFGTGTATDGKRIVAGAPGSDVGINANGIVYVLDATNGSLLLTINNPATGDTDNFGYDNAIDGNLIVSSSVYSDIGATDTGRVYVFNATTGALVSTLINPDPTANDNFGASVAISGNLVAVGTPYNDNGAADAGSVYIFNATTGALVTTIHNPAAAANDHFGSDVDIDGNLVVIGAVDDDPGGNSSAGSIYVFNAITGTLVSTWANPLPSPNDGFGHAVAIDGNIAIAGAGTNNALVSYSFNATTGATIATFTNPDTQWGSSFGNSVDVDGQYAVIGSQGNDVSGTNAGSVFLYNVYTGALITRFYNTRLDNGDEFLGCSVSVKNGIIAAGACGDDIGDGDGNSGSVQTFITRGACTNPTGLAGEMRYNADHRVVQWCDGAIWQAAGPPDPGGPSGGCTTPTATAGFVTFSSTSCTLQYCDGGAWQSMGSMPSNSCDCATTTGNWTVNPAAAANTWGRIVYGNGLFVARSYDGTNNKIMTSPDGITWTARNVSLGITPLGFGNGRFVGIQAFGNGMDTITSTDGITWTLHDDVLPTGHTWENVAYGNGLFVAVASDGPNRVATSPDGITWTPRTVDLTQWWDVTYAENKFVAVSFTWNATNHIMTSPDGINWSYHSLTGTPSLHSITYGDGIFVTTGGASVYTSPDGVTWTARTAAEANDWNNVTYGNGHFVATSWSGTNRIMKSRDGITWTAQAAPEQNGWGGIAYGAGVFVSVSGDGTNRTMRVACP